MAGCVAGEGTGADTSSLLVLVQDIVRLWTANATSAGDLFKKECTDLVRRISLLTYLFEEIKDFKTDPHEDCWCSDLLTALHNARSLLSLARSFTFDSTSAGAAKKIAFQFQSVMWKLEKALGRLPYDRFDISEEVQEQVELVRSQLRRATERYGPLNSKLLSRALSEPLNLHQLLSGSKNIGTLHIENIGNIDHEVTIRSNPVPSGGTSENSNVDQMMEGIASSSTSPKDHFSDPVEAHGENHPASEQEDKLANRSPEDIKKSDAIPIPDDFLCPISLEIMRDPVIVATGQTYERCYIQRWIDSGNLTCPKTRQKLANLTLTPNYVLRSLVSQWCSKHNIEQPMRLLNGKIKNSDGSFRDISTEMANIEALVHKLSSRSVEDCRAAVAEIRTLSKRSTENRMLIADAGAIPVLVNLMTSEDIAVQENAVTSILNLSIYENNKGLIMLAGAVPSIVQVLRAGTMETRENAAATLFSLSLGDENKILIGASGAIPALVDLLQAGSSRGKKDAATALFNLCIYQGNRGRAVRAGIIAALLKMLTNSSHCMVDEALTILSILAGCQEAKVAMVKSSTIPILIDLLRTGAPRNKEHAASILLSLCKRDAENLASIGRLGAVIPLTELAKGGTERGKRKARSLLELLQKQHEH